jgi:hypothetical protein
MLEKHLGNSKKKVAILEQSVENREDLEDANEQLKAHNAELSEAIEQMGIKAVANQQKIQELKGLLGKTGTNVRLKLIRMRIPLFKIFNPHCKKHRSKSRYLHYNLKREQMML